jgi:hypothetical protein
LGWRYPNPKMEALFPLEAMGETAENIHAMQPRRVRSPAGRSLALKRRTLSHCESQRRACAAINAGRFHRRDRPCAPCRKRKGEPAICRHRRTSANYAALASIMTGWTPARLD